MADFPIPEGYFLLGGTTKENARAAIAEAQDRGFGAETVLTRHDGFLIPLAEGEVVEHVDDDATSDEAQDKPAAKSKKQDAAKASSDKKKEGE